ncbi:MAG: mandelate racemase/muconate lactonizing enzyme family protein [Fuerstiella sp.]|nr:mandelate racemase/muconate lactonizing enzyme family protein [Fuerstiella sp.]
MSLNRRQFLQHSARSAAYFGLAGYSHSVLQAEGSVASAKHFKVVSVERSTVRLEYRPVPYRAMSRELPHWRYIEICDVTLSSGVTGTGETMLFYTWDATSDDDLIGRNAVDLMWDDGLGSGLQMALFDAVGRTAGVPVHSLLGPKVHDTTPLSWWNIDTSAADMALDCAEALRLGYMSYKTKGRPWFDIFEQLDAATSVVPPEFKIDMDFNSSLLTADKGMPILKKMEAYPQVDIFESPIPQGDVEGNRRIVDATPVKVAMHFGSPQPKVVVQSGCCDGFVVGGGATGVVGTGRFCEKVGMPFWLQIVGAGLSAAHSLHFGGVLEQAVWPAVNCHQLFKHDLLTEPIVVKDGHSVVPDRPGLGYEIDRDQVDKLRVPKPTERPLTDRLVETTWADGRRMYTASGNEVNFLLNAANRGLIPFYAKGANSRLVPNDGSAHWRALYTASIEAGGPVER